MLQHTQHGEEIATEEINATNTPTTDTAGEVCAHCGEYIADDAHHHDGATYCADCFDDLFTTCDECGQVIPRDECIECNGATYCEECAEDCLTWCAHCEEYTNTDMEEVRTGYRHSEYWCRDCAERYATYCEDCDTFTDNDYQNDDGITDHDGRNVCPHCRDDYYYCDECGEYFHYSEYNSDEERCYECAPASLIKSYHHGEDLEFYGDAPHGARWRGIGCELEIDRDCRDADDERDCVDALEELAGGHIYYEHDGSLEKGFEIITHPHTIEEFFALPWAEMLDACIKYRYTSHDNGRCGLHFHISREAFGSTQEKQARAIAKLLRFFDTYYTDILKVSRRTAEGAERWAARYCCADIEEAREYATGKKYAGRYCAVNLTNRHTIEIRIMRGTLNINTFLACADFVWRIALNSKKIRWKDVDNAGAWLDGMKPATLDYIKRREAFVEVV